MGNHLLGNFLKKVPQTPQKLYDSGKYKHKVFCGAFLQKSDPPEAAC
jgi:hypothetical protein